MPFRLHSSASWLHVASRMLLRRRRSVLGHTLEQQCDDGEYARAWLPCDALDITPAAAWGRS
jgi:hypothetical protein